MTDREIRLLLNDKTVIFIREKEKVDLYTYAYVHGEAIKVALATIELLP